MKIGQIVKFKRADGTLNGGTIINFQKNVNGSDCVLLNTLDGQNMIVSIDKCFLIKHQITGKQSKAFIEKVKNEIQIHNEGLKSSTQSEIKNEEIQLWINKYNEQTNSISSLENEKNQLIKENNELIEINRSKEEKITALTKELAEIKKYTDTNIERELTLEGVINSLKFALIASVSDNQQEYIKILLNTITNILNIDSNS